METIIVYKTQYFETVQRIMVSFRKFMDMLIKNTFMKMRTTYFVVKVALLNVVRSLPSGWEMLTKGLTSNYIYNYCSFAFQVNFFDP